MKFRKMDQNTIKCVLSEQELKDNGLDVYELLKNEDKTRIFLQEVFEAAQREMGEHSEGRFASLEVTLLPNKDVELTLSKSSETEIIKALDHMTSLTDGRINDDVKEQIKEIRKMHGDEQRTAYKNLLLQISDEMEHEEEYVEYDQADTIEDDQEGHKERYNRFYTYEIKNMDAVMTLMKVIGKSGVKHTSLYRVNQERYYLLIDAKGVPFSNVYKFLGTALEFVEDIVPGALKQSMVREHGRCIIPDYAIQVLQEL